MKKVLQGIKDTWRTYAQGLDLAFNWMAARWTRVAAYFGIITVAQAIGLLIDFSVEALTISIATVALGAALSYASYRRERIMRARVEKALEGVDFDDTSGWIGPEDEGYPRRPQR